MLREAEKPRAEKALLIASRAFTVEDARRSTWAVVSTFLVLAGSTALAAAPLPWPARIAASVLEGLTLVRAFCLFHDVQHGALLRGSAFGRAFFAIFGASILVPPSVWRQTHNYHHAHTAKLVGSHIGSYPLLTVAMYRALPRTKRWLYLAARHPLNMVFAVFTVFLVGMCLRPFLRAPKQHAQALASVVLCAGLGVLCAWAGHFDAFVFGWLLPLSLASALGAYLFYAQHNFPSAKVASRESWTFSGAALESSSYMQMGPLMRWFTANIGYHHVHHLNAAIPFYRLPETMAALSELQHPGVTSWRFDELKRCLSLKWWDPHRGAMVGAQDEVLERQPVAAR